MEENHVPIPEGWKSYVGNEILNVQGGYAFKSDDYKDEGVLLVRIGNIGNGNFIFKDVIYIPNRFQLTHSNFQLWKGDVLMGLTGDLGKICILRNGNFPYFLNQRVGRFILTDKIDNEYLFYLISSSFIQSKFDAFFAGGAQKNISPKQIESINYLIPESKVEQRLIASILSKLDEAITQTEKLIGKYKKIKEGLMHDLLTRGIDEQGNIRSEETHKFKDSPLGRIPEEWEVDKLGTIISEGNGTIQTGPFGSQLHANEYIEEGVPVIMPQNILQEGIDKGTLSFISKIKASILKRHITNANDIVFARRGDLSKCAVIETDFIGSICGTGCLLIRINKANINPFWLRMLYQQFNCQKEINISSVGSTMQNLNTEILSNLVIPKISRTEQNLIVEKIQGIDTLIENSIHNHMKISKKKSGLMHDLLTGKVRVKI